MSACYVASTMLDYIEMDEETQSPAIVYDWGEGMNIEQVTINWQTEKNQVGEGLLKRVLGFSTCQDQLSYQGSLAWSAEKMTIFISVTITA